MRTVHVAFPLTKAQDARLNSFIEKVRESEDKRAHVNELTAIVAELVDVGLNHYFWTPVELAKLGAVSQKMIKVGMNSGKKTLNVIAGKVIKGFSDEQMETIVNFLESLILETE